MDSARLNLDCLNMKKPHLKIKKKNSVPASIYETCDESPDLDADHAKISVFRELPNCGVRPSKNAEPNCSRTTWTVGF
jgi:hypothetical protein